MTQSNQAVLGFAICFLIYQGIMFWMYKGELRAVNVLIGFVIFTIGWCFISPLLIGEAKAQTSPPVKERMCYVASRPGAAMVKCIEYPQWGADASTFPERCDEGSYRSRLNCARMEWDKKYTQ